MKRPKLVVEGAQISIIAFQIPNLRIRPQHKAKGLGQVGQLGPLMRGGQKCNAQQTIQKWTRLFLFMGSRHQCSFDDQAAHAMPHQDQRTSAQTGFNHQGIERVETLVWNLHGAISPSTDRRVIT